MTGASINELGFFPFLTRWKGGPAGSRWRVSASHAILPKKSHPGQNSAHRAAS